MAKDKLITERLLDEDESGLEVDKCPSACCFYINLFCMAVSKFENCQVALHIRWSKHLLLF